MLARRLRASRGRVAASAAGVFQEAERAALRPVAEANLRMRQRSPSTRSSISAWDCLSKKRKAREAEAVKES